MAAVLSGSCVFVSVVVVYVYGRCYGSAVHAIVSLLWSLFVVVIAVVLLLMSSLFFCFHKYLAIVFYFL